MVEREVKQPVELLDNMHPQQFVMISKAYSDGISLRKDGPQIKREFYSDCILDAEKSYRTAATFTSKLVPKHFVTTLTVADELIYYESIAFERRTVLKNFSETTNIFLPKEVNRRYYSGLLFNPNATTQSYIAGIELCPAQKCVVTTEELNYMEKSDPVECGGKKTMNGDIDTSEKRLINGEI